MAEKKKLPGNGQKMIRVKGVLTTVPEKTPDSSTRPRSRAQGKAANRKKLGDKIANGFLQFGKAIKGTKK